MYSLYNHVYRSGLGFESAEPQVWKMLTLRRGAEYSLGFLSAEP